MRIAFAGSRGVPALYGGFETAVEEIGARLAGRGHDVSVYCRAGYDDGAGPEYRGMRRVLVPYMHRQSVETLSHTFSAFTHALGNRPDALIVMNPANGPLLVLPRLARIPCAINVDGLDWERAKWPPLGRRVICFGAWCCTKLAPVVIADSQAIRSYYRERWGRDCYYASYGADPYEPEAPRFLGDYGLKPDSYLLVVARLDPENNTDLLIRAYERLETDLPLVIVGDTRYESDYVRRLKALANDRVRFLGVIYDKPRLRELLANSIAYLHGHSVGGTNPVLVDAMACRACVLYVDVPFNAEVVGDAGVPFPAEAATAAERIAALLNDPARREVLRDAARERQEARYTWEKATDAYEALCRSLAETGRAPASVENSPET